MRSPFSSAKKIRMQRLQRVATDKYTDSSGSGIMSPLATSHPFCLPSAFTLNTSLTFIFLYSGPGEIPMPIQQKHLTHFYQCLRLCSCGTKPQRSENHHFVMTSSWEPQCHHDIIMRTPRIIGKPKFSCSGGP